jgi:CubicO group peptidase (beta-lactamase class C family)
MKGLLVEISYSIAAFLAGFALAVSNTDAVEPQQPAVFPDSDWLETPPEEQGVDSVRLNDAMAYLGNAYGGSGVSEAVVIRNGYMIWKGENIDELHTVHSCTKAFTSTVLGLLIDEGKCNLDSLAINYLPNLADTYPEYARIKLRHLASMTSGYDGERGDKTTEKPWGDELRYIIPTEPLFEPGTAYKYHDAAVHLLGYIMTRIAGEPLQEIFRREIADPIGMKRWEWKDLGTLDGLLFNSPSGIYSGGIHITAQEMARFGYLFLNRGNWNGKQLISASWVDQATTNQVPATFRALSGGGSGRYGFFWWTNGIKSDGNRPWPSAPSGTYAARGGSSNYCFVIPEWNMVIVRLEASSRLSFRGTDNILNTFFGKVADALNEQD